jgi:uncharacterized membrane protein YjdF
MVCEINPSFIVENPRVIFATRYNMQIIIYTESVGVFIHLVLSSIGLLVTHHRTEI